MVEKMKVWQLADWGKQNLQIAKRDVPRVGPRDVLVRVHAVSLNFRDRPALDNIHLLGRTPRPYTPCSDLAGEIVEVGSEVKRWKTGERVSANYYTQWFDGLPSADMDVNFEAFSLDLQGTLAEYVLVPEGAVVRAPDALSMEEISTLPVAALTAWSALVTEGKLRAGQSVLLQGTGGVSLFGLQFARMSGARVIMLSRSAEKLERVKALGAVEAIDTSEHPNWAERVRELTRGRGADHIFETIGGDSYRKSLDAAAMGARITTVGFLESNEFTLPIVPMIVRRAVIQGLSVGHRRAFEDMIAAIEVNGLKPVIDHVYDWKDVPAAFDHLERGAFGKIVISVNPKL